MSGAIDIHLVAGLVDLLPALQYEAPFDLIFIDADKVSYPLYLDWALKLARPGSIIVGDNCVRQGNALQASETMTADSAGLLAYNQKASTHPQLTSLALPLDDNYTDGFTISVVRSPQSK